VAVAAGALGACATVPSGQGLEGALPIGLPDTLVVEKHIESSSTRLRGPGGGLWVITTYRDSPVTGNQASDFSAESLNRWRADVKDVTRRLRDSEHLIQDSNLDDGGVLLLIARQSSLIRGAETTGTVHSYVEFQLHWPGSQPSRFIMGSVEWSGALRPTIAEVVASLHRVRYRAAV